MAENRCSGTLTTPKQNFWFKRVSDNSESISEKNDFLILFKEISVEIIKNVEKKILRKNQFFLGHGCFWTVFDLWSLSAWFKIRNLFLTWPMLIFVLWVLLYITFKAAINYVIYLWFERFFGSIYIRVSVWYAIIMKMSPIQAYIFLEIEVQLHTFSLKSGKIELFLLQIFNINSCLTLHSLKI